MNIVELLNSQRKFFSGDATKDLSFRKKQLLRIESVLEKNESKLNEAIYKDLGKSGIETYSTELSFVYNEIQYFIKNLNSLSRPKRVSTNLINQLGSSKIYYEPLGCTLIIGTWNYPYQMTLVPAVCALAAGNTVILKPSEVASHTANVLAELINSEFPPEVFHVVTGGVDETTEILKHRFDKIFFTGSPHVGKIVYQAAATHLTPVTLELGGKSPAIVTASANIKVAARRIVWGKFLNAGQTCIAPDYLYVDADIEKDLLEEMKKCIIKYKYTKDAENYSRIVNSKNLYRLQKMLDSGSIYFGGEFNEEQLYIEPTILTGVTWEDSAMQEEIFGPILPVLPYDDLEEVMEVIKQKEKPLSAYIFTSKSSEKELFIEKLSFGGGCINDTVMHITNSNLPFGGVGNSGIGNYHGLFGFLSFSHQKSVIDKATWGEPDLRYPPYTNAKRKWIKRLQ
ncbi:MAG: aldehyde dehydrogenase [Saprospiraceae bacterium]|nr:aldehyde dehydrogenase [Saprospiraceae bacterium]